MDLWKNIPMIVLITGILLALYLYHLDSRNFSLESVIHTSKRIYSVIFYHFRSKYMLTFI